jgi:hypothetical protein
MTAVLVGLEAEIEALAQHPGDDGDGAGAGPRVEPAPEDRELGRYWLELEAVEAQGGSQESPALAG